MTLISKFYISKAIARLEVISEFARLSDGIHLIFTKSRRDSLEKRSSTARGGRMGASKKHFFRRTKIPYPDKSRLFDRGFPGRAVYFTYKVTRWITRTLFLLGYRVLHF